MNEQYKTLRNALRRQLKQAKLDYYHYLLNENKGNAKKTWDVINELTNIKRRNNVQPWKLKLSNNDTVTEPQIIAEKFNSFFVNNGKEIAVAIQRSNCNNAKCSVGIMKKIKKFIFLFLAVNKKCSTQLHNSKIGKLEDV